MSDKVSARNLMERAGVPVAAGSSEPVTSIGAAIADAQRIGYPVMIKAVAGGGGIGMSVAADEDQLRAGFETARSRAERFFGHPEILLERSARRGADPGPGRRTGRAARRAGLLGPAPPSEDRRGDAVAGRHAAAAGGAGGNGSQGGRGGRISGRGNSRAAGRHRLWRLHLPGDEYPAAGRA